MISREEFQIHLKPAVILGLTVVASLVFYLVLVEVLRAVNRPFRGFGSIADVRPARFAVFGAAVIVIILIRWLRPRLLRADPGEEPKAILIRLQRAAILTMVLGEVPAILGLAFFLVTGHNFDFYALLFASFLLVFMYFPRRADWEERSSS